MVPCCQGIYCICFFFSFFDCLLGKLTTYLLGKGSGKKSKCNGWGARQHPTLLEHPRPIESATYGVEVILHEMSVQYPCGSLWIIMDHIYTVLMVHLPKGFGATRPSTSWRWSQTNVTLRRLLVTATSLVLAVVTTLPCEKKIWRFESLRVGTNMDGMSLGYLLASQWLISGTCRIEPFPVSEYQKWWPCFLLQSTWRSIEHDFIWFRLV